MLFMKQNILFYFSFLFYSTCLFSQTKEIELKFNKKPLFKHFNDCQKFDQCKINGKEELRISKSYLFDEKGNLIKSFKSGSTIEAEELVEYVLNGQNKKTELTNYKKTHIDSVFEIWKILYLFNNSGLLQKRVSLSYFPKINYLPIDEKNDSQDIIKNAVEFDNPNDPRNFPRWAAPGSADLDTFTGPRKIKMKPIFLGQSWDTATVSLYAYNSKGQLIKQFNDAEDFPNEGTVNYLYDEKGVKEILYYYQNSYKRKNGYLKDSLRKWNSKFRIYRDTANTLEYIKQSMVDSTLEWNSSFTYSGVNSFTETLVSSTSIIAVTHFTNEKGQIIKSIREYTQNVQNKYLNERYIPVPIDKSTYSAFTRTTTGFQYDKFGRIEKCTYNFEENRKEGPFEFQSISIFKYKDDKAYKLPKEEYFDMKDDWHE